MQSNSTDHPTDLLGEPIKHDHATGKVRALLCPGCNNGMGCFKDDPVRLQKAISYLTRHKLIQEQG